MSDIKVVMNSKSMLCYSKWFKQSISHLSSVLKIYGRDMFNLHGALSSIPRNTHTHTIHQTLTVCHIMLTCVLSFNLQTNHEKLAWRHWGQRLFQRFTCNRSVPVQNWPQQLIWGDFQEWIRICTVRGCLQTFALMLLLVLWTLPISQSPSGWHAWPWCSWTFNDYNLWNLKKKQISGPQTKSIKSKLWEWCIGLWIV
jgi:hypothetical protein